jgi:hypothetical protein
MSTTRKKPLSTEGVRKGYFIEGDGARMTLSLYDVPVELTTKHDTDKKEFTIQFEYVSSGEATRKVDLDHNIVAYVGKRTNRLYRLVVSDVKKVKVVSIQNSINSAMDELKRSITEKTEKVSDQLHYQYMDDLLKQGVAFSA